jgi:anti-anti-sigma regulatory factor
MAPAQPVENTIHLTPPDKLDASNSRQLISSAKVRHQPVAVDMSQVKLISNCGLLALTIIDEQLTKADLPPLRLLNLQPHIKQALDFSGFHNYIE